MKLKLDEKGSVVVQEGKPVYVYDDGREAPFDAQATVATISRLNGEARTHREAKESIEAKYKPFEGIEDADAARKALDMVKNIDEGKLFQAGKVEEIKAAAARTAQEQVAAASKANAEALALAKQEAATFKDQLYAEKIGGSFGNSKFIKEKLAIPHDLAQAAFGSSFKVEDGKIIAYDKSGNKIFSRTRPGEFATFDESIEQLVDSYPNRDAILKGSGNSGGGAGNSGQNAGGKKSVTRGQWDSMDQNARMAHSKSGGVVGD